MKFITLLLAALMFVFLSVLVGCGGGRTTTQRVELGANTFLEIQNRWSMGLFEGAVHTSLAIEWPHSWFLDHVGAADGGSMDEIRLLDVGKHYILIYGRSVYHRPISGGAWKWWPLRNSFYSPPVPSLASYLRDWFLEHDHCDFEYVPYIERVSNEQITFRLSNDKLPITFGSLTHWTLPYRLHRADVAANSLHYRTDMPGLPADLVFTGPTNYFGAWQFDPKATSSVKR